MPLSNFWGATIDRSVAGQVTLSLDGVSVTVPWDGTKPSKSDIYAAFVFLNDAYLAAVGAANKSFWDYRCQYARCAWKVIGYNDYASTLPGNQRKPYTDKAARLATFRDQFKTLAGE